MGVAWLPVRPLRDDRQAGLAAVGVKVLVHLGEHATPEAALAAWREDIDRARSVGRAKTAARIEAKIRKLEGALSSETT